MDFMQHGFAIQADRPLLGAFALAACLAGGTATQNHAGVPRAVDTVRFASGWDAGAPRQPDRTITAMAATLAPPAAAPAVGAKRLEVSPVQPNHVHLTKPITLKPAAVSPAPAAPAADRIAALAVLPSTALPVIDTGPASLPDIVMPAAEPAPQPQLAAAAPAAPVAPTATEKVVEAAPAPAPAPLQLVTSPELRRFDLAKFDKAPPRAAKLAASRKSAATASAKARPADRLIDGVVYHHASVEVAGQAGGDIAVRIGPDMKPSVKVADLLGLVSAQMDPDTLARFQLASSASDYVSFATLRSAGFEVKYNAAADSIAISVAP